MDLKRYLELYLSESQDHMHQLGQGLLALESGQDPQSAVEAAFRAAHTIKGMSATMGFRAVTDICHQLEDRLDDVRSGRLHASREVVDELLARADALEKAIQESVEDPQGAAAEGGAPEAAVASAAPAQKLTAADGPLVARVNYDPQSPMKAARAMLLVRALDQKKAIRGAEPSDFGDDFNGVLLLKLADDVDLDAIEQELRKSPDVVAVALEREGAPPPAPVAAATDGEATRRAPARLVRVDQAKLGNLSSGIGELTVLQSRLDELSADIGPVASIVTRLNALASELQNSVLAMQMVPVGDVFDRFPRVVRDAARATGKEIDFHIEGREIELDRAIIDEMVDPLVHLIRNAVDHGIEGPVGRIEADKPPRGQLVLRAMRERNSVRIELEDDGRGVNAEKVIAKAEQVGIPVHSSPQEISGDELLRILSHPGFSTAEQVTEVSGRGVGLDAVLNRVRALGGAINLETRPGEGSTFTIRLPITLAVAQALHVRVAGEDYAIPLTHVSEALMLDGNVAEQRGREVVGVRGDELPLVRLRRVLGATAPGSEQAAVIAEVGERRSALAVDELVGREQILVKDFDGAVGTLPIFSGVTLLADGRPALVLDPLSVV
jgi:two-component system, chemotaxis family, sensor kinase CheA